MYFEIYIFDFFFIVNISTGTSSVSSVPTDLGYCTEALRKELLLRGYPIGPITASTKKVYLKRLARLRKGQPIMQPSSPGIKSK